MKYTSYRNYYRDNDTDKKKEQEKLPPDANLFFLT